MQPKAKKHDANKGTELAFRKSSDRAPKEQSTFARSKSADFPDLQPPGKHIATLLDSLNAYEREHPEWRIESLESVMDWALRCLRLYVEDPGDREITWEQPFVDLRVRVDWNWEIDEETGTPRGGHVFGPITKENTATRKMARETVANLVVNHLTAQALAGFTGWVWKSRRGNFQQTFLPIEEADELDAIRGRQARRKAMAKIAAPFCFGRVSTHRRRRLLERSPIEITGDVNGRKVEMSLIFEVHPLVADYDAREAYHPITVGLFLAPDASGSCRAGQTPAAWPTEDRTVLWERLLAEIPKLAGQLIRTVEQSPE